jgi:ABC-2 type transport system permease protein
MSFFPRSGTALRLSRALARGWGAPSPRGSGAWFKRPETPTLIVLGTSLPQLFLTGFSWPREAIPKPVLAAGYIFPSDFAIDGLVRIDQLGASLWEVAHDWRGLWALAIIYFALAVFSEFVVKRRRRHG